MTRPSKIRIPQQFLPCRDYGHTWLPYDARIESRPRRIKRILVCGKCNAKRTQTLDSAYEPIGNSYVYPKGYVVKGRLSREEKAAIRSITTPLFQHGDDE